MYCTVLCCTNSHFVLCLIILSSYHQLMIMVNRETEAKSSIIRWMHEEEGDGFIILDSQSFEKVNVVVSDVFMLSYPTHHHTFTSNSQ